MIDLTRCQCVNRVAFGTFARGINEMINTLLIKRKMIYLSVEIERRERAIKSNTAPTWLNDVHSRMIPDLPSTTLKWYISIRVVGRVFLHG